MVRRKCESSLLGKDLRKVVMASGPLKRSGGGMDDWGSEENEQKTGTFYH